VFLQQLDRVVSSLVLANVLRSLRISWGDLAGELRRLGPTASSRTVLRGEFELS
jgi:hypothetical protein